MARHIFTRWTENSILHDFVFIEVVLIEVIVHATQFGLSHFPLNPPHVVGHSVQNKMQRRLCHERSVADQVLPILLNADPERSRDDLKMQQYCNTIGAYVSQRGQSQCFVDFEMPSDVKGQNVFWKLVEVSVIVQHGCLICSMKKQSNV